MTTDYRPQIKITFRKEKGRDRVEDEVIDLEAFIDVKGIKAKGNRLTAQAVNTIDLLEPLPFEEVTIDEERGTGEDSTPTSVATEATGRTPHQSDREGPIQVEWEVKRPDDGGEGPVQLDLF